METLGFVGLGRMGRPMAAHLVAAGHDVVVYDRRREAIEDVADASSADSAAEVGDVAAVVFLSLPGPKAVEAVAGELAATLDEGSIVVDTTTSTPETTRTVADRLAERDVTVLGAPVSGGTAGAVEGTLTAMVGGEAAAVERCRPMLEAFASDVVHVGPDPGHGHAVKLLNNYLSFSAMVATSEAVALGRSAGLDLETMCAVFNASTGRNSATEDKFPDFVAEGRDVGFSLSLMEKDARLLMRFADENDVSLPLAGLVRSEVGRTRSRYGTDGDMTDVYDYVREATGIDSRDE